MNDLSEKEQLDEMRAWWAEYGRYVIVGVVVGFGSIFGWVQWQQSIAETREAASMKYEEIMTAVEEGDVDTAESAMATLSADYTRTVYPDQGRLAMARLYMDKGRDQDAARTLRDVLEPGDDSVVTMVARGRLARILLYQNKPDEVIELLKDVDAGAFAARYAEILGDAHVAKGNYEDAKAAYSAALGQAEIGQSVDAELIRLKLNDLPDPAELAAASDAIESALDEAEEMLPVDDAANADDMAEDEADEAADPESVE